MALINNTLPVSRTVPTSIPGAGISAPAPNISTPTGPKVAQNQSIPGLMSPSHPALSSSPSVGPVKSMKVLPDGTVHTTHETGIPGASIPGAPSKGPISGASLPGAPTPSPITGAGISNPPQSVAQPTTTNTVNQAPSPQNNATVGSFTTPSGAVINSSNGSIIGGQTPPAQKPETPQTAVPQSNLNKATTGLLNTAEGNTALGQAGNAITQKYAGLINPLIKGTVGQETGDRTTGTSPVGEGNAAVAAAAGGALIQGLTNQEQQELSGTGQAITAQGQQANALNAAGNLSTPSTQFLQVPYSNQVLDANGNPVGGGAAGTLPSAAQNFVNSIATQVKNGQMTRDEANSQLNAYGPAGLQALNTALGQDFNTNASNSSAATTATGQQIKTAADSTNKALDTLASSFSSLNSLETGGIPLTNSIAQWIGANAGDSALTQYKTNLADARSQLIGVLNSSGGTPTGNEATANSYLPDNMTPAQFNQNVGTAEHPGIVRQLIAQKVGSFTQSGQQNNSNGNSNSNITWDTIVK